MCVGAGGDEGRRRMPCCLNRCLECSSGLRQLPVRRAEAAATTWLRRPRPAPQPAAPIAQLRCQQDTEDRCRSYLDRARRVAEAMACAVVRDRQRLERDAARSRQRRRGSARGGGPLGWRRGGWRRCGHGERLGRSGELRGCRIAQGADFGDLSSASRLWRAQSSRSSMPCM